VRQTLSEPAVMSLNAKRAFADFFLSGGLRRTFA
jgi:hypothetical protein